MTTKVDPRAVRVKSKHIYNGRIPHNIDTQMKRKELTNTFIVGPLIKPRICLHIMYADTRFYQRADVMMIINRKKLCMQIRGFIRGLML